MSYIRKYRWPILILSLIILSIGGFTLWASFPYRPMPEAFRALESDSSVAIQDEPWLVFQPQNSSPKTGLILYPGGRVDPEGYAPFARSITSEGYLVVIVPMPLNLAVFAPGRASDVIQFFPEIESWAIGGHSLGGAMAANFAKDHPDAVDGLLLLASYPASSDDLSSLPLRVTSIYATLDGFASLEEIDASRANLPDSTRWVQIVGGNHSQFGWYGFQNGDNTATISRQAQQELMVSSTMDLLQSLEEPSP
jgi:dienelactone hydrolase